MSENNNHIVTLQRYQDTVFPVTVTDAIAVTPTDTSGSSTVAATEKLTTYLEKNASNVGTLSDLTTTEKGSLVGAVNEVKAASDETKQTVDGYFTEKKEFPDVLTKEDIVATYEGKVWNGTEWETLESYGEPTYVCNIERAKKIIRGYWYLGGFYLCKSIDSEGNPVDVKDITSEYGKFSDCSDYNFVIINGTKKGVSIRGAGLYSSATELTIFVEKTQYEYDQEALEDNNKVQPIATKYMTDGLACNATGLAQKNTDHGNTVSCIIIGTNARCLTASGNGLSISSNPRLESLYVPKAVGLLNICANRNLSKIVIDDTLETTNINLQADNGLIEFSTKGLDTSSLTHFSTQNSVNLKVLEVADMDTSKITSMNYMFNGCTSLQTLDVSNWNTAAVTNMQSMFNGCTSLQTLDVSNWNTAAVTNMNSMFYNCQLTSLDLSSWDFSNVTRIDNMFCWCVKLASIKFGTCDMGALTTNTNMFARCNALTTITGTTQNIKKTLYIGGSPLTRESALVVINGLADLTDSTAQTLTLNNTTKELLTEEDLAIATEKNWNIAWHNGA